MGEQPVDLAEAVRRVRTTLDRIPDSDAVTLDKTDVGTLLAAYDRRGEALVVLVDVAEALAGGRPCRNADEAIQRARALAAAADPSTPAAGEPDAGDLDG